MECREGEEWALDWLGREGEWALDWLSWECGVYREVKEGRLSSEKQVEGKFGATLELPVLAISFLSPRRHTLTC